MSTILPNTRSDSVRLLSGSDDIKNQHVTSTLPGVLVLSSSAIIGTGTGRLKYNSGALHFKAPGSTTWGPASDVPSNGTYLVFDGVNSDKYLRVQVYASYLRNSETEIHFQHVYNNEVATTDIAAADATAGIVELYELTLKNFSNAQAIDVKAWIEAGVDNIEISDDGVTYVAPDSEGHGDVLTWASIEAGASETLYLRRTISAASAADPSVQTFIKTTWKGI